MASLVPAAAVTAAWLLLLTVALRPHLAAMLDAPPTRDGPETRERLHWLVTSTAHTHSGRRARTAPHTTDASSVTPTSTPGEPAEPAVAADTGAGVATTTGAPAPERALFAQTPLVAPLTRERFDSIVRDRRAVAPLLRPVGPPDHDAGRAFAGRAPNTLTPAERSAVARAIIVGDAARATPTADASRGRDDVAQRAAVADVMRGWHDPGAGRTPPEPDTTPRRGWRRWVVLEGLPGGGPTRGERARGRAIDAQIVATLARAAARRRARLDSLARDDSAGADVPSRQ